jgi:proliferating cell nuclear antigen
MDGTIFEARTIQTSNIRSLFEILKDLLTDINLIITKDKIKITALNNTEISFIFVTLDSSKFESYKCDKTDKNPLILGINTDNIFKIIKTIKHDETISFYVKESEPYHLYIKKENSIRNSMNTFKIDLHSIDYKNYEIPPLNFETVISMASSEFQKLCKDYYGLGAKTLEIKNVGHQLFFSSDCEFCKSDSIYGDSQNTKFSIKSKTTKIVQGKWDIKYLLLFSKASNLSDIVDLHLRNDYPLVMVYKIGTLGELKFIVSYIE